MDEATVRLTVFLTLIALLGTAQFYFPRRQTTQPMIKRWRTNFGIVILNSLLVRLIFGALLPVAVAEWAAQESIGLFNTLVSAPVLAILLSIIALDATIYWQHRVFHRVPWLWRLHRIHHYDTDYDLSTALRFHPIEILLSILIKNIAILLIGAPVMAVIIFEILLNGMALFNHANLALPRTVDRVLRKVIVTPDMHRVHHSVLSKEMHSNFGFNLSIWDRLFSSYIAQPKAGHLKMKIGQPNADELPTNTLVWLLGSALRQKPKP